ncbi:hypothetical protein DFA_04322 [Cavenderia fasciculata]|uniref:Uncharacterized protein n=1 Tax=Cavenderia fasciculata TaxID=261658 RepID=F4PP91_CACFS|nr:uncharacterized protein DFA_04322 [Cavenderia fasciculata]EGG22204.1 hypothetical protein DFA_04322 [Cavenderia fasciculata]|eukprot:XP_004360055.1 hypothetical protein DFA_04322 [Cavenderia fasciculata]
MLQHFSLHFRFFILIRNNAASNPPCLQTTSSALSEHPEYDLNVKTK